MKTCRPIKFNNRFPNHSILTSFFNISATQSRCIKKESSSKPNEETPINALAARLRGEGKGFCKICYDQKRSLSEYSSHNLRNSKGLVCCPNVKCFKCNQTGHFDTTCRVSLDAPLFKQKNIAVPVKETPKNKVSFGAFSVLDESSSDEDEPPAKKAAISPPLLHKDWSEYDEDD